MEQEQEAGHGQEPALLGHQEQLVLVWAGGGEGGEEELGVLHPGVGQQEGHVVCWGGEALLREGQTSSQHQRSVDSSSKVSLSLKNSILFNNKKCLKLPETDVKPI